MTKARYIIYYILIIITAAVLCPEAAAQVDAQFTQYYAVPTFYNAGATGDTDFVRLRGGTRLQWMGIDNAPKSFLITGDMPFKFIGKRFGTGLVMQQESLGLYKNLNIAAQLSYKHKLFGGVLSAGLQVGIISETFKGSEVYIPDHDD